MPAGRYKSRRFRRVFRKTPGGNVVLTYRRRKPSKPKCSICGAILSGVPTGIQSKIGKLAKTKKRPERKFGGTLCSKCARREIIKKARA